MLVILLVISFSKLNKFEYYDLENNYGTSSKCVLTENGAECLIDGEMKIVNQFNERNVQL